jgi:hypothetical protein
MTDSPRAQREEDAHPPTDKFEPPTAKDEPPTGKDEPPTDKFEPPTGKDEPPTAKFEPPTLRGVIMAHKRGSAAVLGILALLLASILITDLTSRGTRISDSSPCSVWSSATQRQRDAYAARYVTEHGALPSGASDAGTIEGVIDGGCTQAYGFDEADTVTVLQALRHEY